MSSIIKNVPIEEASIDAILSTTGVYSCIGVLIVLNDNRAFVFHSDPSCIDLENEADMQYEVQKLIKETILMFKERDKKKNSRFERIFMIGGLDNGRFKAFHEQLERMREDHTKLVSRLDGLDVNDLQNFVNCIVYHNVKFNLDGGDADAVEGRVLISDLPILIDLTSSPAFLLLASIFRFRKKSVRWSPEN